jgi:penicillin-binding protein 1A
MQAAGADYVQQFSTEFGFVGERNPVSLPLALGAGAVTPLQLAQSYAVFSNGGYHVAPRLIQNISDRSGRVLFDADPAVGLTSAQRVISERNAYIMDSMLQGVVESGTGRGAQALGRSDAAGKTGTSNEAHDAWFAGYSSGVVSVVWLGHDQPKSLGNATGGVLALPIWQRYMQVALKDREVQTRSEPAGIALYEGDYIYAEYLDSACLDDPHAFIYSTLECGSTAFSMNDVADPHALPGDDASDAQRTRSRAERARILQFFSPES